MADPYFCLQGDRKGSDTRQDGAPGVVKRTAPRHLTGDPEKHPTFGALYRDGRSLYRHDGRKRVLKYHGAI